MNDSPINLQERRELAEATRSQMVETVAALEAVLKNCRHAHSELLMASLYTPTNDVIALCEQAKGIVNDVVQLRIRLRQHELKWLKK